MSHVLPKKEKRLWLRITLVLTVLILISAIVTVYAVAIKGYILYRKASEELPVSEVYSHLSSDPSYTYYRDLPKVYVDAVIATEDKRFEKHNGIDIIAICRAVYYDIKARSFVQGGSTITQQLSKNLYFSFEKTFVRKAAEVFAAHDLENCYSKEQILEMYVNTIYFGDGYYGISEAADGYFERPVSHLSDAEAVMLAGIPNAPSAYDPRTNIDLAIKRMDIVLGRMVRCGRLSEHQEKLIRQSYPHLP